MHEHAQHQRSRVAGLPQLIQHHAHSSVIFFAVVRLFFCWLQPAGVSIVVESEFEPVATVTQACSNGLKEALQSPIGNRLLVM